jgi:hypothetical protein
MGLSSATISTCKTFLRKSTEARAHAKALGSILRTTKKKKKKGFMSLLASQLKQLVGVDFDPFI